MPKSEKPRRGFGTKSCSEANPTAAKTGVVLGEIGAGLAVCATTQIEQEEPSVWLGWLWVDSTAAVHNIRDRQSQAVQRPHNRIDEEIFISCFGIRLT